jgi:putative ABC transport system permease protein
MFRNYLKTAFRNLSRETSSTFINLSGLTLGITSSLVLFLMVMYFISFDKFHTNKDRIYRIVNQSEGNDGKDYQAGVPAVLPEAFRTDFPEAEEVVFTSYRANGLVTIPQRNGELKKFQEERGVVYTEPSFFKVFDRTILSGKASDALNDPNEAIISKTLAKKYFDKDDVIGEVLKFENKEFKITAIMEDALRNSDFPFDLMLSYVTVKKEREEQGWHSIWSDEQCYFLLKDDEQISKLEARLPAFGKKYLGDDDYNKTEFFFQPLKDLHFDDRFDTYSYSTVPKGMIIAFSVIALVLILTACINFINLSTAEAIKRSKEVGVRKTLGSSRGQLIAQFLGETTMVTLIAMMIALACTQLALGFLNPFLDISLSLDFAHNANLWFYIIGVTLIVSVCAGLYPAFVISGYKPVLILKNQINNKNSSSYALRKILVVLQFFISQLLIIVTIVIINQMNFFQKKDLGFAKDAILIVPIPEKEAPVKEDAKVVSKMRNLREEISRMAGVEEASLASAPPSSDNVSGTNFSIIGIDKEFGTQVKQIDGHYTSLYKLDFVAGKNVQDLDTAVGFIVNEKLVRTAGIQDVNEIIGKELKLWGKQYPVVGVVKDFHTVSLRDPIEPTVLFNRIRGFETLALKVNLAQTQNVIDALKTKWEAAYPEHLFEYHFLDDNIKEFYEREKKMSTLLTTFTTMAIFIGCLGLFGLATFMANQKRKEIGVRKVMGASVESIVIMFSKEYVKLIIIGFLIAAPVAWYFMNSFLNEFAYKIELGPGTFLAGLGITLFIAMITVAFKSFRAAIVNPVNSLRCE